MEYESKLSDIIASLPEVSGGFLYSPETGIYSNQTGAAVSDTSLQQVSLKLTKIVSMLSIHFNDTGAIRITFKNQILYGIKIEDENWLFLLHQPSLAPGMIKMTVQMALNIQGEDPPAANESLTGDETSESAVDIEALLASLMDPESELSLPLTTIQEQLATRIGPVAELVFGDSVASWSTAASPSLETLPQLLAMLEEEIDDEDDCESFRQDLKQYREGV